MSTIITSINDAYIKADGACAVYLFVHLKGKKLRFATDIHVKPDDWDSDKKCIKGTGKKIKDDNLVIGEKRARLQKIFTEYRLRHKELTPELLKDEFRNYGYGESFYDFMKTEIEFKFDNLKEGSGKHQVSVLEKMKEWRKELMLTELSVDLLNAYAHYLKKTLSNCPNTVQENMKTIKTYVNLAYKKKKIETNPFDVIKIRMVDVERSFLEPDELNKLINLYNKQSLSPFRQKVLRHFLFPCFTGLRISDLQRIKFENIFGTMLVFTPHKTRGYHKQITIPLIDFAQKLIADENSKTAYVFNMYSESVTRRTLKDIISDIKIIKPIPLTFHSSRHTFATMFLRKTKNLAALQKLLGHARVTETMKYAHVMTEDIEREMQLFNSLSF